MKDQIIELRNNEEMISKITREYNKKLKEIFRYIANTYSLIVFDRDNLDISIYDKNFNKVIILNNYSLHIICDNGKLSFSLVYMKQELDYPIDIFKFSYNTTLKDNIYNTYMAEYDKIIQYNYVKNNFKFITEFLNLYNKEIKDIMTPKNEYNCKECDLYNGAKCTIKDLNELDLCINGSAFVPRKGPAIHVYVKPCSEHVHGEIKVIPKLNGEEVK